MNKFIKQYLLFLVIIIQQCGCMTAGTHGSIKTYNFNVPKKILQDVAEKVISENIDIHRDTIENYMINITNGKNDTIFNNTYNDGQNYITIKIESEENNKIANEYVYQYVGTEEDWNTLKTSSLSLTYAYDANGNGGSEESNSFSPLLLKHLTNLFESKFILKIEKELKERYSND